MGGRSHAAAVGKCTKRKASHKAFGQLFSPVPFFAGQKKARFKTYYKYIWIKIPKGEGALIQECLQAEPITEKENNIIIGVIILMELCHLAQYQFTPLDNYTNGLVAYICEALLSGAFLVFSMSWSNSI